MLQFPRKCKCNIRSVVAVKTLTGGLSIESLLLLTACNKKPE